MESNFKVVFSCQIVKDFSCFAGFCLDVESLVTYSNNKKADFSVRPGFHYTANATTTAQKQSDYKVEQSSFTLIALF